MDTTNTHTHHAHTLYTHTPHTHTTAVVKTLVLVHRVRKSLSIKASAKILSTSGLDGRAGSGEGGAAAAVATEAFGTPTVVEGSEQEEKEDEEGHGEQRREGAAAQQGGDAEKRLNMPGLRKKITIGRAKELAHIIYGPRPESIGSSESPATMMRAASSPF